MSLERLQQIGRRQHGVVTRADVTEHLDTAELKTALRRGWLVRERPGVLVFGGSRRSWDQAVLVAVLSAGTGAMASHPTAAALWDVPGFPRSSITPIEITVPRGRRPRTRGVRVHTATLLLPRHCTTRDTIPTTSAARTVCDLGGRVSERQLGRVVDELLMRRATTMDQLIATHRELRVGSRASRALERVLSARGVEWDLAESTGEARLVRWLVAAGLPQPVQQHEVGTYRVDLAYPDHAVFIEYDGFDFHRDRTSFDRDRRRDNTLQLQGAAVVLRYTSRSTSEQVVREVTEALRRAGWRPSRLAG
jgi:very-short-patch-repair endonuclease